LKYFALVALLLVCAVPMFGQASTFQNTCSGLTFSYGNGSQALLTAWCLQANGTARQSSLALQGVSNQNGNLVVSGSGASSFQQSCGNIMISGNASGATLSALCRNSSGGTNASSVALNGIRNNNGSLSY